MPTSQDQETEADVCLLLEGTYPYVLGGVSAWVHQIITGLPEVSFALFFIGSQKEDYKKREYALPSNVVCLREMYLHEKLDETELTPAKLCPDHQTPIYENIHAVMKASLRSKKAFYFWKFLEVMADARPAFRYGNILHDPEAWEAFCRHYEAYSPHESFIDYFWTTRFLLLPLWGVWRHRQQIPKAKVYHSVSAGYAGFAGALAARIHRAPYIVTEHGIYTKERLAEISQADWIFESEMRHINLQEGMGRLKQLWIDMFVFIGQLAYDQADEIITLYEGNALTQIEFGADENKIRIIPNGIELEPFKEIREAQFKKWRSNSPKKSVGFIGRVVPIKDVKTLLRAARLVCERLPDVEFLIAGPYSEDPAYFDECSKIVKLLDIEDRARFLGRQQVMDVLPQMDVIVLTSISEGLPLVILEAMACGIPIVATDVGACRELIFGRTPADKALGRAGKLTKIMSPEETARSLISLLSSPKTMVQMGQAGYQRGEKYYSMAKLYEQYRKIYNRLMRKSTGQKTDD